MSAVVRCLGGARVSYGGMPIPIMGGGASLLPAAAASLPSLLWFLLFRVGDSATSGTLSTSIQPDGEAIVGVLVNLVMNAMEAVDARGKVEFDCSMRTTEDASIPRNSVVWSIRDNGPGPDEQIRDSMFEPFVTTKLEGVGLGLSMCKRVAVALGGELRWERKEGWTVFEFSVPEQESSS